MASRKTTIDVPDRKPDEAPATAEQLQIIRHLVAGMSLQGFRFDYRKLGQSQASAVLVQLQQLKEAEDYDPVVRKKKGPGFMTKLIKNVVVLLFVLAFVGGGGYAIYYIATNKTDSSKQANNASGQDQDKDKPADTDTKAGSTKKRSGEITLFGLPGSDDEPSDTDPGNTAGDPTLTQGTPGPNDATLPGVDPVKPIEARKREKQIQTLRGILVWVSANTDRTDDLSTRKDISERMTQKLDEMPELMGAIERVNPTLAQRIRTVVKAYGEADIDYAATNAESISVRKAFIVLIDRL